MTDLPRRTDVTDPVLRSAIERLRSNTNVAMLQALGGEFIYDDEAAEGARGHAIEMQALDPSGKRWRLMVVRKR